MCDYCDCRSHHHVASLSQEHERLLVLLGDLQHAVAAGDDDEAHLALAELRDLLAHDGAREEVGIFAELRHALVDDGYVARFEHDHRHVHALLAPDHPGVAGAEEIARALSDHIAREESDLFPAAHQLLTPAQWDAVDDASRRHRDLTAASTTGGTS